MSIAFVAFGVIVLVITPCAVELSVFTGVGGCGRCISSSVSQDKTATFALIKRPPSSDSAAEDITALMICAMFRISSLFGGCSLLLDI